MMERERSHSLLSVALLVVVFSATSVKKQQEKKFTCQCNKNL